MLLAEAAGRERAALVADPGRELSPAASRLFGEMVRRRLRREPVAYILGRRGFRRIELAVDGRVLVPRPETELLVELALELEPRTVLDVGTGSGAIALALADELPGVELTATDTSAAALEVARANADRLGLTDRVEFLVGSLPEGGGFDLILANLPYVAESEWSSLQPEVTKWEPREALLAGPDGLDAYRERRSRAGGARSRGSGSRWGRGRRRPSPHSSRPRGYDGVETRADLAGIERLVVGAPMSELVSIQRDGAAAARTALEHCIAAGGVAVFPADGLYGLACDPLDEAAIERIHRIKGRDDGKPSAVLYFSPLAIRELLGWLGPATVHAAGALLPGPVTLVVANPERRYPLACREDPREARDPTDRGAPCGGDVPALPDLGEPQRRAGAFGLRRSARGDRRRGRPGDRRRRADRTALDRRRHHRDRGRGGLGDPPRGRGVRGRPRRHAR